MLVLVQVAVARLDERAHDVVHVLDAAQVGVQDARADEVLERIVDVAGEA